MIFHPHLVREIRAGRKTMTRRKVKPQPCRYREGKSYAVQPGRGKTATCRVKVIDVRQEPVGAITFTDAVQEGFQTTEDFKAYWVELYDAKWLAGENAMLDEAELDDGVTLDRDTWIRRRSLDMFERRHASTPVWVISFVLDGSPASRFLALQSDELYVTNTARAFPHEPEAVDVDTQKRISVRAGMVTRQWTALELAHRERDRMHLSREEELARLRRAARLRSIDATRELWALENLLKSAGDDAFKQKVRKTEARIFRSAA